MNNGSNTKPIDLFAIGMTVRVDAVPIQIVSDAVNRLNLTHHMGAGGIKPEMPDPGIGGQDRTGDLRDQFDIHPERLIVDGAYGSGPMLDWLVKRDIDPHNLALDHTGRKDGTWSRADFEWDAENNQYICPEGPGVRPLLVPHPSEITHSSRSHWRTARTALRRPVRLLTARQ